MGLRRRSEGGPPASAEINAYQSTTSTSYADLTAGTVGPAVTVHIGSSRSALVFTKAGFSGDNTRYPAAAFAVSGATTIAAADADKMEQYNDTASSAQLAGVTTLVTGLNPGSNTFTMKYKTNAGTASFGFRRIIVVPL